LKEAHAAEIEKVGAEAEQIKQHAISQMKEIHAAEMEKVKVEVLASANSTHAEQLEQLRAAHEEMDRYRSELEGSSSQAIAALSATHAQEIDSLVSKHQSSSAEDLKRIQDEAEKQRVADIYNVTNELNELRAAEIGKVKSELERSEQLATFYKDETDRVRSELDTSVAEAISKTAKELSATHVKQMESLRAEIQSSANSDIRRVQAESK